MASILISGASSGFGALAARALADAGHTVYAGMRNAAARPEARAARQYGPRPVELDVTSDASVEALDLPDLDVLVHNAGHMVTGPAEAFTVEQYLSLYDTNVMGAQRLNRGLLPAMRARGDGLVVWVGSSSTRGGTPADAAVADEYESHHPGLMDQVGAALAELEPAWADVGEVAQAIVRVVGAAKGTRPFRVHVDPSDDGAEVVNAVADRVRAEFLRRIGLADLLRPAA